MYKNLLRLLCITMAAAIFQTEAQAQLAEDSVMKVRVRYAQLMLDDVPEYKSYDELMSAFKYIRDTKFLSYDGVDRKIPWEFVKEFCHVRAQHAVNELVAAGFVKPKKIFLHGILDIRNSYFQLKKGELIWQHIAPIVSVGGVNYVLDPALDKKAPMELHKWISSMTTDYDKIMLAACDGDTFVQTSSCSNPDPNNQIEQDDFRTGTEWALRLEWNTISNQGYDPAQILLQ